MVFWHQLLPVVLRLTPPLSTRPSANLVPACGQPVDNFLGGGPPCAPPDDGCRRWTVEPASRPRPPLGGRTVKRSSFGSLPFALDRNLRSESCRGRGCEGSGNRDGKEPRRSTPVLSTERVKGTLKGEPTPSTSCPPPRESRSRRHGPRWVDFSILPTSSYEPSFPLLPVSTRSASSTSFPLLLVGVGEDGS